jgi:glycosyltransferase involved in cell wall biosynthesis
MVALSVILATKNEKEYIGTTLRKLVEAQHEAEKHGVKTEIIVVDSSSDGTSTEAKKYVKNVHRLILDGLATARNFGANLAKGDILAFMDADTTVQKSSLVDLINNFKDTTVVSVVSRVLPSSGRKTLSTVLFYALDGIYVRLCAYLNVLIRFYNRGDLTAVRKDVFQKIAGFNEKLHMLEITEMLVKASAYGRVKVLPSPVFESSRRLAQWGLLKSYKVWWRNYFSFYVLGHLYDPSYESCRGEKLALESRSHEKREKKAGNTVTCFLREVRTRARR